MIHFDALEHGRSIGRFADLGFLVIVKVTVQVGGLVGKLGRLVGILVGGLGLLVGGAGFLIGGLGLLVGGLGLLVGGVGPGLLINRLGLPNGSCTLTGCTDAATLG